MKAYEGRDLDKHQVVERFKKSNGSWLVGLLVDFVVCVAAATQTTISITSF